VSALLGGAITQAAVQDEMRGRLAAVDHLASSAGPALGDLESGVVAAWIGVGPTIALGGLFTSVGVAVLGTVRPAPCGRSRCDRSDGGAPAPEPWARSTTSRQCGRARIGEHRQGVHGVPLAR
jgi:hypothetical protein